MDCAKISSWHRLLRLLAPAPGSGSEHRPQQGGVGCEVWRDCAACDVHRKTAELGGHLRTGVEDTFSLPDLPLSLWAAFASDLRTHAAQLQRCTSDAARASIYAQLVGSLGVYGLTDLSDVIRRGADAPDPIAQALRVARLLKAHARSIEAQLRPEASASDAPAPHHGQASGT